MVTRPVWWSVVARASEVLTIIEQTQILLERMRNHVTEGTTLDLQVYGRGVLTPTEIGERTAR